MRKALATEAADAAALGSKDFVLVRVRIVDSPFDDNAIRRLTDTAAFHIHSENVVLLESSTELRSRSHYNVSGRDSADMDVGH